MKCTCIVVFVGLCWSSAALRGASTEADRPKPNRNHVTNQADANTLKTPDAKERRRAPDPAPRKQSPDPRPTIGVPVPSPHTGRKGGVRPTAKNLRDDASINVAFIGPRDPLLETTAISSRWMAFPGHPTPPSPNCGPRINSTEAEIFRSMLRGASPEEIRQLTKELDQLSPRLREILARRGFNDLADRDSGKR